MRFSILFFSPMNALTSLQINNEEPNKVDCVRKSVKFESKKVDKFEDKVNIDKDFQRG